MQRPEKRLPHIDMDVVQVLEPDNFDPSTGEVIPGSLASGWYFMQDDTGEYNQFHVLRHSFNVRKYIEDLGYKIEKTEDLLASLLPTNAIIPLELRRPNIPKPVLQPLGWNPSQEKLPSVVVQAEKVLRRQ